jgi:DNA polymerase
MIEEEKIPKHIQDIYDIEDSKVIRCFKEFSLDGLYNEYKDCQKCQLCKSCSQIVLHRGNPMSDVVFMGEAGGATEDQQGKPFVGRSGKLLDNIIRAIGLEPDDVYICNACLCRPPNNRKPTKDELDACRPRLISQLDIIGPKVIIALGGSAAEALLGPGSSVTDRRRGMHDFNGIPVKVTYHPAYCLRNPKAKVQVWEDVQEVMRFLGLDIKVSNNEGKQEANKKEV